MIRIARVHLLLGRANAPKTGALRQRTIRKCGPTCYAGSVVDVPSVEPVSAAPRAGRLWWALLQQRLQQVATKLPLELSGVIQFEITAQDATSDHFFLELKGPKSRGLGGEAAAWNTKVVATDRAIGDLLFAPQPPIGALTVHGDFGLYERFMRLLEGAPAAKSWVGIRSNKK